MLHLWKFGFHVGFPEDYKPIVKNSMNHTKKSSKLKPLKLNGQIWYIDKIQNKKSLERFEPALIKI